MTVCKAQKWTNRGQSRPRPPLPKVNRYGWALHDPMLQWAVPVRLFATIPHRRIVEVTSFRVLNGTGPYSRASPAATIHSRIR
jgi:hypothetical protein